MNYRSWEDEVPEQLLLTMVPNQRGGVLKEDLLMYHAESQAQTEGYSIDAEQLLNVVPLP